MTERAHDLYVVYAQMRGETLEELQKSRKASMQYSVAGGDAAKELADRADSRGR